MADLNVAFYLADQNPDRDRSLGITRMTECLAREMYRSGDVSISQLTSRSSYRLQDLASNTVELPWRTDNKFGRIVGDQIHPLFKKKLRPPDVWFYPKGYLPWLLPAHRPNVIVVHDTILQWYADYYPDYRGRIDYEYWCRMMRQSIAHADHIIAVSETTKSQILELCERFKIQAPGITVTYEGTDFETEEPLPELEKRNFALHLASSAPHKKTNLLLLQWHELELRGVELPALKLIGGLDAEGQALLNRCKHVEKLPRLDDAAFRLKMKEARVIIIPSEIEGFGLPALEAYYCGTPVCYIASTSVEEILVKATGKGAFKLGDLDSLQSALEQVLSMRHEEVLEVRRVLKDAFSLTKFAESTLRVLRSQTKLYL